MRDERFNPDGLALSADYARTMKEAVLPAIAARRTDRIIRGAGDRPLFTSRFDAGSFQGTAVIVHGFTENADKFSEIIHSLLESGFSVVAYDQRGHGRSWRWPGIDDLSLTHADRFEDYVEDLEQVVAQVLAGMPRPWVLFAHSMGGAVSALYLEKHPDTFARAALCAPMIAPDRGGLRYAVDCSNGMASLLVRELFPDAAAVVNDTPDGRFPAHSPNPLKAEAREQIAALVRENGLDAGVVFDGDADRCMFVDENGDFVSPDCLVPVVAASLGAGAGDRVLHDVRTSRGAIEAIRRLGAEPVMSPVGHAFAKPLLRSSGAVCGGELAGHYYFREFHCCDSGALAALKILGEVAKAKREGMSFSGMMRPISGVYANSGELNFRVEDKDAAIGRVLAAAAERLPAEVSRSDMDGLRLEFAEGWVNVRRSNTEPYLRLVVECDTPSRLEEWKGVLSEAISAG